MREFIQNMIDAGLADVISRPVSTNLEAAQLAFSTDKMLVLEDLEGHKAVMNTVVDRKSLSAVVATAARLPETNSVKLLTQGL